MFEFEELVNGIPGCVLSRDKISPTISMFSGINFSMVSTQTLSTLPSHGISRWLLETGSTCNVVKDAHI